MGFIIRDLQTYDEMLAVHRLQQEIWQLDDNVGLYPPLLYTASKYGGVVLGAFDRKEGSMIGFLFSYLGQEPGGPLKLHSQTMGVKAQWRGKGAAEALKREQRRRALERGLPLITWTFDPLEGANANLNLHKLRAISKTYLKNFYGKGFGGLNAGLPNDRLLVEWWVNEVDDSGDRASQADEAARIFITAGKGPDLHIVKERLDLIHNHVFLQVPGSIQQLKAANLPLAQEWREKTRTAFEAYFANGYQAIDFLSAMTDEGRLNFYVLER
jgi:predicted GNAT superfamily acetyltransferase